MRKLFVILILSIMLAPSCVRAQHFISFDAGLMQDNTLDKNVDLHVIDFKAGFNYMLLEQWYKGYLYVGIDLGYSMVRGEEDYYGVKQDNVGLFTITPRATYLYKFGYGFYWTPSFYYTYGFGSTKYADDIKVKTNNHRIGLNIFSFDYRWSKKLSFNATLLPMYYNIVSRKYSADFPDHTLNNYNGLAVLGISIGAKWWIDF